MTSRHDDPLKQGGLNRACWHRTPVSLQGGLNGACWHRTTMLTQDTSVSTRPEQSLLTQDTSVSTGWPVDTRHQCFQREAWTEPVDRGHQCFHREAWTEDTREARHWPRQVKASTHSFSFTPSPFVCCLTPFHIILHAPPSYLAFVVGAQGEWEGQVESRLDGVVPVNVTGDVLGEQSKTFQTFTSGIVKCMPS